MTTSEVGTAQDWVAEAAASRIRTHEEAEELRSSANREFVDRVQRLIASRDITARAAASAAGMTTQTMYHLFKRYPAT